MKFLKNSIKTSYVFEIELNNWNNLEFLDFITFITINSELCNLEMFFILDPDAHLYKYILYKYFKFCFNEK